jgi:hypothetical protein
MNTVCKNCGHSFNQNYKYCPHCGQVSTTPRLNFHLLVHDVVHAFLHADKGIFLLLKELSYKPGKVGRLYVEGQRKKYFNPFNFLVVMVAIAVFLNLKFELFIIPGENVKAGSLEFLHFVFKYFNVFIFILCPVNALLTWLSFRRYNMNYIENVVLSAYMSGQIMFFNCIFLIVVSIFSSVMRVIGIVAGILMAGWSVIAILQFYKTRSFGNIVKAIFIVGVSQILAQALIYFTFNVYKRMDF